MTDKKSNIFTVANLSVVAFAVFAYFMLAMRNGYMLRWYDEMSLFEPTRFFFNEFLNYPGGLLRYAGAWLTQFMYYPALGSIVLIALWLLLAWVSCKAFGISKNAVPLGLMVPMAMLASIVQLDEAWLTLRTPGYIYSNTLGYLFVVTMVWLFRLSESRKILSLFVPALICLTYFMTGFYGLFAAFLCLIFMLAGAVRNKDYKNLIAVAVTLLLIYVIPNLYFSFWHDNTVDNDYLLLKGLPELLFSYYDLYLWTPFIVASLWLIVLSIFGNIRIGRNTRLMAWISVAFLVFSSVWVIRADRKSEQLRASVLMMRFIEQGNWAAINNVMENLREEPNYTMLVINNLASASQGYRTLNLPKFAPVPADGRHSENFTMSIFVKVPVNYYIGENNLSYRWAMEHTVQYGKRVFFLKYMVKNSLVRGEIRLARKYNDILMRTMFHRKWAEGMNRFIDDPSLIDSDPEFQAVRSFKKN